MRKNSLIALVFMGCGAAACAGTPETAISVPGMAQYTDASFGFSFWYPAKWTVKEEPYDDPSHPYSDGGVVKSLVVSPPAVQEAGIEEIHLREFVSPDENVIDSSQRAPSYEAPYSIRYYFDARQHLWMTETKMEPPEKWSSPKPADISENSMGGLHLFSGTARFDADTIVPLSAKNFVIAEFDNGSGGGQIHLARTIVALNPAVATPASKEEQIKTIRTEGVLYGALGKRLGSFFVDDLYVYDFQGKMIPGVSSPDFKLISKFSDGAAGVSDYGTDGRRVYFAAPAVMYGASADANEILEGADPGTFICLRQAFRNGACETGFTRDKSRVWYLGRLIGGADPDTFVITGDPVMQNPDETLTIAHDDKHTYGVDAKENIVVEK